MGDLTQEFYDLRLELSPLLVFIDDIKALKRSKRISEESSISLLSLLALEIKEDIITTVRSLQMEESRKLKEVEAQLKDIQKETRDKVYDQTQQISNIEMDFHSLGDMISRQGGFIENQNKNFDSFKKDLNDKASNNDLLEFKKTLKRYTPIGDFNHLSNQVIDLASKSSVELIRKELIKLEKRVKIYITQDELANATKKSEEVLKDFMSKKYLCQDKFEEEKVFTVKRFDRLEEDIQILYQKNDALGEAIRKKLKEVFELIKKRPWDSDVQHLQNQIDECSSKSEFRTLVNFVNPKIESFSYTITEMNGKVYQFEKILERYDEILLDKASKDDVRQINTKLPAFALQTKLNDLNDRIKSESVYNSQKFVEISSRAEEQASNIQSIFQRIEAIRRDNAEVSSIASTLISFSEKLTEKADKSDIYLIYDVMGRKEDILTIKELEETAKKQVEMIVIILQSLCRTMLKGGETPADIRKQRSHLYRNLTGLLSWINGEEPNRTRVTPPCKSPMNINLKTEADFETGGELLNSTRNGRKFRRNVMTTSPRRKGSADFVNLPRIS